MVDLSSYNSIQTNLFIRIQVDEYRTTPTGSYSAEVLRFSDYTSNFVIDGETYSALGGFLSVSSSTSEIRPTPSTVSLSISGIPNESLAEVLYSKIKGAPVSIYRAYFNVSTGVQVGDTVGRFRGFVNNYALTEDFDVFARTATNTITIDCSSNVETLAQKIAGRQTNPESMKKFYPNDLSFDRVPNLKDENFNFGAVL